MLLSCSLFNFIGSEERLEKLKKINIKVGIFIGIEIIFYIMFLYFDRKNQYRLSSLIKYLGVIFCFGFELFFYAKKTAINRLLIFGMFFTVVSDYFLLFTEYYIVGVSSFLLTQFFYMVRLQVEKEKYLTRFAIGTYEIDKKAGKIKIISYRILRNYLIILGNTIIISFILYSNMIKIDILLIITVIYFQSLVCNVLTSINYFKRDSDNQCLKLFTIGLILFLFCDINVGLYNLTFYSSVSGVFYYKVYEIASICMWVFYLPSQVLIAMSGYMSNHKIDPKVGKASEI